MISILKKVGFLEKFVERKLEKESQFYMKNRDFVLSSYRYLLKTIPSLYSRKLQQKQKLNELQYIFRSQKVLESLEETKFKSQKLRQIVQAIKQKNYGHLGEFEIGLYCQTIDLAEEFSHYNKKYPLFKRKY